jgi:hypothetical protein
VPVSRAYSIRRMRFWIFVRMSAGWHNDGGQSNGSGDPTAMRVVELLVVNRRHHLDAVPQISRLPRVPIALLVLLGSIFICSIG